MKTRAGVLLQVYQGLAGLSDTTTGLLLLLVPAWTLQLMHVRQPPERAVFSSFIGTFVLGVGLSYLWVLLREARGVASVAEWQAQWRCTALIRTGVAVFLVTQIASARLEAAWITVAASDAALATIQWIGLSRGWLGSAKRDELD